MIYMEFKNEIRYKDDFLDWAISIEDSSDCDLVTVPDNPLLESSSVQGMRQKLIYHFAEALEVMRKRYARVKGFSLGFNSEE